MTRLMYDSTSPSDIPRDAEMVAYYVDGRYAWPQAWLDLFPDAVKVSISAIGAKVAMVGDVENGCIWPPANAVDWVLRARAAGYDPTIYVNERNDWGPTRAAFDAAGVAHPHWWVANYNGIRSIPAGAVAKQFAHPPMLDNLHYDLSVVADHWPGVDTTEQEEDGMANFTDSEKAEVLAGVRKLTTEFTVTHGTPARPLPLDQKDDVVGHVMSERARLEQFIEGWRIMNAAVARLETLANDIKTILGGLSATPGGGVAPTSEVKVAAESVVAIASAVTKKADHNAYLRAGADLAELESDHNGT